MTRMAILTSHPIQYQVPLFRALSQRPELSVKVFYCWDFGVRPAYEGSFGVTFAWDIEMLSNYEHEFLPNSARSAGTDHFLGLMNPGAAERILDWKPDMLVVHGYNHWTELKVMRAAARAGIPVLLRGESTLLRQRPWWVRSAKRILLSRLLRSVFGVLSIGSYNREYWRHYGVSNDRIFDAPYTVDNSFFRRHAEAARQKAAAWRNNLGIASDRPVVLFSAKLIAKKRPADLLAAFAASGAAGRASLVIAGDGALRPELQALARSLGIETAVHFIGFQNQSEMPAVYALGNLFVLPSDAEPWGLAVNEAMTLGLPVIVSDAVGSAPDLVSRENGWTFPAGNIPALTAVLREALEDTDGLLSRGRASLQRMTAWDIQQTAEGFLAAAAAVNARRGPQAGAPVTI